MFARLLLFFVLREDEVWSGFLLAGLLLSQVVIIVTVVVCLAGPGTGPIGMVPKWWGLTGKCAPLQ